MPGSSPPQCPIMSGTMYTGTAKKINVPHAVRSGRRRSFNKSKNCHQYMSVCSTGSSVTLVKHSKDMLRGVPLLLILGPHLKNPGVPPNGYTLLRLPCTFPLPDDYSLHCCCCSIQPTSWQVTGSTNTTRVPNVHMVADLSAQYPANKQMDHATLMNNRIR